jgi:hypothetical protein
VAELGTTCEVPFLGIGELIITCYKLKKKIYLNINTSENAQKRLFRCVPVPWERNSKERER